MGLELSEVIFKNLVLVWPRLLKAGFQIDLL